ncbi:hypothetical protein BD779DRAFT_1801348 [Infundibulicybe gibba]|nr:hypothetical protein BD779DRAFT_1801348 [Infundibulicybe gibba]
MKTIFAVLSALAAAYTVSAGSGIYDNAGKVQNPRGFDVRGDLELSLPPKTNAERLRRGMAPFPPTRRSPSRIAMRPRASGSLCQPLSSTNGFIKPEVVYFYPADTTRLVVKVPSVDSFGVPIDITAVGGPDSDHPFVGAVGGSGGFTFGSGKSGYAYLSGTGQTPASSPPSSSVGHSIQTLGYNGPAESRIWTLSCETRDLTAQWTNADGKTVPATVMYDPAVNYIGITGDLSAFNAEFKEGAYAVTLTFVPQTMPA